MFARYFEINGPDMLEPRLTQIKEEVFGLISLQKPVGTFLSVLEIGVGAGSSIVINIVLIMT